MASVNSCNDGMSYESCVMCVAKMSAEDLSVLQKDKDFTVRKYCLPKRASWAPYFTFEGTGKYSFLLGKLGVGWRFQNLYAALFGSVAGTNEDRYSHTYQPKCLGLIRCPETTDSTEAVFAGGLVSWDFRGIDSLFSLGLSGMMGRLYLVEGDNYDRKTSGLFQSTAALLTPIKFTDKGSILTYVGLQVSIGVFCNFTDGSCYSSHGFGFIAK
ncbi:MAG: hypothetical protein COV45_04230 [Deltaproteobacteria bacterium CG11_big_fil_rev_8_21_14_0_20_47_16]|nr:MAG: hypothetical protein COV45_04230 [Deltaproteobacteria bacterium CG11_big_fil_rev_8_21_14_0_20_47_16]